MGTVSTKIKDYRNGPGLVAMYAHLGCWVFDVNVTRGYFMHIWPLSLIQDKDSVLQSPKVRPFPYIVTLDGAGKWSSRTIVLSSRTFTCDGKLSLN